MERLSRREAASPFDALSWALCLKNRRAARALLERRETLSWQAASDYAHLTLGWAPDLLAMILDRAPEGEELFCLQMLICPGGEWVTYVCAGLLTAAAALDDLQAVELLLDRGYETDEYLLYRQLHLSPHFHQLSRLRSTASFSRPCTVHILPRDENLENSWSLDCVSPLGAAILCGATRCALRLLRETDGDLPLSARNALAWQAGSTSTEVPACMVVLPARRAGSARTAESARTAVLPVSTAVPAALGRDLAELLDPGDFQDRSSPLFLECMKRHRDQVHPLLVRSLIDDVSRESWARECLRVIDPGLVSDCALEMLRDTGRIGKFARLEELPNIPRVFYGLGLDLVLDRNAVSPNVNTDALLDYLDHARVVGDTPPGSLSGLAVNLLDDLLRRTREGSRAILGQLPLITHKKAADALTAEDPAMIWMYLSQRESKRCPVSAARLALTLLGMKKEDTYEL